MTWRQRDLFAQITNLGRTELPVIDVTPSYLRTLRRDTG
jgi:hypothetical protein